MSFFFLTFFFKRTFSYNPDKGDEDYQFVFNCSDVLGLIVDIRYNNIIPFNTFFGGVLLLGGAGASIDIISSCYVKVINSVQIY